MQDIVLKHGCMRESISPIFSTREHLSEAGLRALFLHVLTAELPRMGVAVVWGVVLCTVGHLAALGAHDASGEGCPGGYHLQ